MRPYLYIAKIRLLSALAYRFDVFSTVAIQCLIMIASSFFWIAAYSNRQSALGVTKEQMLTYTIMSGVLACLFTSGVEGRIIQSIRRGNISLDILKPVNLFGMYLAEDVGGVAIAFFQNAVPLLIIAILFIAAPLPASGAHLLLFLLSAVLSYMINWLFAAVYGMWAFWAISMGPMQAVKGHLVRLLSGSIIPLWFFPGWLQGIMRFLPFQYIYQLPLSIYIGKLPFDQMMRQMGLQVIWLIIFYILFSLIQKKVLTNVLVQGG